MDQVFFLVHPTGGKVEPVSRPLLGSGLKLLADCGPWEGPVYGYRGAEIWNDAAGTRWQVWIDDHSLRGVTLHRLARAIEIVDAWADGTALPPP